MNEKYKKYLPVGSVVLLKEAKKRIMIIGFCAYAEDNKEKLYDYTGVMYPEGYIDSKKVCLFNHNQIDKIYCLGLADEEEKSFKLNLIDMVNKLENKPKQNEDEISKGKDFLNS